MTEHCVIPAVEPDALAQAFHIERFQDYMTFKRGSSPQTIQAYTTVVTRLGRYAWAHEAHSVAALTPSLLRGYLRRLQRRGLSATSIGGQLSAIRSYCRFLMDEKVITRDPSEPIDSPKRDQPLRSVLTVEEVRQLLAATVWQHPLALRDRAMLELAYGAGLRVGEWISVTVQDVILDAGVVRIFGKGSKERIIPIGHTASEAITVYLRDLRPQFDRGHSQTLFLSTSGSPLSKQRVSRILRQYVDRAGITTHVSPHTLRRSFATHLLAGGADLVAIRDMMGHVDIETTQLYLRLDCTRLHEVHQEHHPRKHLPTPTEEVVVPRPSVERWVQQFRRCLLRNLQGPPGRRYGPQITSIFDSKIAQQKAKTESAQVEAIIETFHVRGFWTAIAQDRHLSAESAKSYSSPLAEFLVYAAATGEPPGVAIGEPLLREYLRRLTTRHKTRVTTYNYLVAIRAYCAFAVQAGIILRDPTTSLHLAAYRPYGTASVLTVEDTRRLLDAPSPADALGARDQAMLMLAYEAGLCVHEWVSLTVDNLRLDEGLLVVGTGAKERRIPLRMRTIEAVRHYLTNLRPTLDRTGTQRILFLSEYGRPMSRGVPGKVIEKYLTRTGITRQVTPHEFHRMFAIHALEHGGDVVSPGHVSPVSNGVGHPGPQQE